MASTRANKNSTSATPTSDVADYFTLLKPRVMYLVVFTGLVGLYLAPGSIHPFIAFIAILCIAVGSGAAGAINMWYDADIDAIMTRTQKRPIPAGKILANEALNFGILLSIASVCIMGLAVNITSAILLAAAILFYVFIYTMYLKRKTPQNIVIGGAAGSFPPLIGWAAVTNTISIEGLILFAIIFMWTPPHFWALSLFKCGDYAKAKIPMLPVTAGDTITRKSIFIYTVLMIPTTLLPVAIKMAGMTYLIGASVLGLIFLYYAWRILTTPQESKATNKYAKITFGYSILYLFLIFVLLVIDKWIITLQLWS